MRVLLFLALIYPAVASASAVTVWEGGNGLLSDCEERATFNEGVCAGYLSGVMDAHQTFKGWGELTQPTYCKPDGVTLGQVRAIVVKSLKENPEELHLNAASLVLNALRRAFPPEIKFEDGEVVFYCP